MSGSAKRRSGQTEQEQYRVTTRGAVQLSFALTSLLLIAVKPGAHGICPSEEEFGIKWTDLTLISAGAKPGDRHDLRMAAFTGKLFVFGGSGPGTEPGQPEPLLLCRTLCLRFTPVTRSVVRACLLYTSPSPRDRG
eukprot:3344888-Rhodomonas_salina.1